MNNSFLRTRNALAVAQMLGLHRDPKYYHAKPLQAERARRLWWKLYDMDRALSLFMGRPYTIIDRFVDVELPIPYDDIDITPGQDGEMIIDRSRPTKEKFMYFRLYKFPAQLTSLTTARSSQEISSPT
jgi:Fungal specific transcription factor domain